jgi:hypothetical protein
MNDLDSRTISPRGSRTTGLEMTWVQTDEGLRIRWTLDSVATPSAIVAIDAVTRTQPGLAA